MTLNSLKNILESLPRTERMPVLFVGHGSPTNAVEQNKFTADWMRIGARLPKPQAVLCISAHWFADGTYVHGSDNPKTIHDFYGFPQELYSLNYPCPGAPTFAQATQQVVTSTKVGWDTDWGLDHGCWVVMRHLIPNADVPVFQMSVDFTKPDQFHYDLGRELAPLRERGVMVLASGNIVHNLGLITFGENVQPYDWATEFDETTKDFITSGNYAPLIHYKKLGIAAHHSVPTPDHYWPMLYALGLQQKGEEPKFFAEGITYKSISMRSFIFS